MDARALALALPLTARAATRLPTTTTAGSYSAAPPHAQPASSGRDEVARACSVGVFAPTRALVRDHVGLGTAAEAHLAAGGLGFAAGRSLAAGDLGSATTGRTLAAGDLGSATTGRTLAAGDLGLATTGRTLAAGDLGLATTGRTLAAGDLGLATTGRTLAAGDLGLATTGRTLAAGDLGLATTGRTLAAGDLGLATTGRTLAAGDLGFATTGRSLDLSSPFSAGCLRSSTDGLAIVLGPHPAALLPASTGCLETAQDAGLQARARRGLSVVCRAYPLGKASPSPNLLHPPASIRPGFTLRPGLLMGIPTREGYLNLHSTLGYLVIAAKSQVVKFHFAVGCVILAVRLVEYVAKRLHSSELLSGRVKLPESIVTFAAIALFLGKALFSLMKQTKDSAELIIYFIKLHKHNSLLDSSSKSNTKATTEA